MIEDLINQIQDKNIPVSVLLIKAKILATKLNDTAFLKWIDLEISGYKEKGVYPEYRKITGQPRAWNPYRGWCPLFFKDQLDLEQHVSIRMPNQSTSEIEELLNNDQQEYEMPFPDNFASQILADDEFKTKVSLFIGRPSLIKILDSVRNLILDWVLNLEKDSNPVNFFEGFDTKKGLLKFAGKEIPLTKKDQKLMQYSL